MSAIGTTVVTTTYGDRWQFLKQVVSASFENGVSKVVIVDNGSQLESRQSILRMEQASNGRVVVVHLSENIGSAGGYKAGLQYVASDPDLGRSDYVWLLDDDNVPERGVLPRLLSQHRALQEHGPTDQIALLCLREDREYLRRIADGESPENVLPKKSSLFGFHVQDIPAKVRKHLFGAKIPQASSRSGPISLPFAPYGGLFFRKSILWEIGFPDERFFLYGDDHEYTHRLTSRGGKIFLVPDCSIRDAEKSWHVTAGRQSVFSRLLSEESDLRVYYALRNGAYLATHVREHNRAIYGLNSLVFTMLLFSSSLAQGKLRRFSLMRQAIREGERGNLGENRAVGLDPVSKSKEMLIHVYGAAGYNLGDDAIAFVSARQLAHDIPDATIAVTSLDRGKLQKHYGLHEIHLQRNTPTGYLQFVDSIRRADAILIGGGTVIQDKLGLSPARGMLAYMLQVIVFARLFRKRVASLPIGVDALTTSLGRRYAKTILSNLAHISTRDKRSMELVRDYANVEDTHTSIDADPAFLIDEHTTGDTDIVRFESYLVVSLVGEDLSSEPLVSTVLAFAEHFFDHGEVDGIVLLAMDGRHDEEMRLFREIEARSKHPIRFQTIAPGNACAAFDIICRAKLMLAMRLHAMIFGLGYTPMLSISRTTKTDTFTSEHGIPSFSANERLDIDSLIGVGHEILVDSNALERQRAQRNESKRRAEEGLRSLASMLARDSKHL